MVDRILGYCHRMNFSKAVSLTLAASALVSAATATAAQTPTITLHPNVAGRQSQLTLQAEPGESMSGGQQVKSVVLSGTRGLKVDPRSRAKRCSAKEARDFNCPEASRIGSGEVKGHASGTVVPGGRQDFTATIDSFLAPKQRTGDIAGVVFQVREPSSGTKGTTTGRIVRVANGPFGVELRFDDIGSTQPQIPGVTITIDSITLHAGAKRTVVTKRRVRRHRRLVTIRRTHRYSLLTNPRTCSGLWPFRLTIGYSGRADDVRDGSAACTPR